jgi:hypothetical protein
LIANNQVKDEGAKDIGNALQYNTSLTKLYLGNGYNKYIIDNNGIGNEGAEAIGKSLKNNGTLSELYLGNKYLLGR